MNQSSEEDGLIRRMARCLRAIASLGVGLWVAACTTIIPASGPPTVIYNTPFGSTSVSPSGSRPGDNLAIPPTGLMPTLPPPVGGNRNGTYSGTAVPLNTGGGLCITNQTVKRFHVHGNSVRWGRFHGTIAPDNGLQMVNGNTWVFGQFVGTRFDGQISTSNWSGPGCSWIVTLERTGA
jgi:hypothetical protein